MNKKTKITLISLIFALIFGLIILISTLSGELSSLFDQIVNKENIFEISLKPDTSGCSFDELTDYIGSYLYVPNYDSDIKITPLQNPIQKGNLLKFDVKINDTGIIPMDKSYFYIYVIDPNKKLRGCFPRCECRGDYKCNKRWSALPNPFHDTIGKSLLFIEINDTRFGFYRESLIKGEGSYVFERYGVLYSKEPSKFYYTFPADEVGNWEIYVLAFNEEYKDRHGEILKDYWKDIVKYEKNIITVKGKEEAAPIETLLYVKIFVAIITSIITFISTFTQLNKAKNYDKFTNLMKETFPTGLHFYIGLMVILIVFLIIQYLIICK
ncbi:MAG: hypothetical protein CVT89_04125 [Candidatus Altiarchaeales archaeon HGW-Altiarchaeales-2]|nr:MAG: hypothetical protein CVT89_04125 [Candidatus Altiarchaeales archaeon HGW-Altiarchaeales-2]